MRRNELIQALRQLKVQTGSLACLGCGHEHNCSIHGCTIIRAAVEVLENTQWIKSSEQLPDNQTDGETVLAIAHGIYKNVTLLGAVQLAGYFPGEGWVLDEFPAMEHPSVSHWMPLPAPPEEGGDNYDCDKSR